MHAAPTARTRARGARAYRQRRIEDGKGKEAEKRLALAKETVASLHVQTSVAAGMPMVRSPSHASASPGALGRAATAPASESTVHGARSVTKRRRRSALAAARLLRCAPFFFEWPPQLAERAARGVTASTTIAPSSTSTGRDVALARARRAGSSPRCGASMSRADGPLHRPGAQLRIEAAGVEQRLDRGVARRRAARRARSRARVASAARRRRATSATSVRASGAEARAPRRCGCRARAAGAARGRRDRPPRLRGGRRALGVDVARAMPKPMRPRVIGVGLGGAEVRRHDDHRVGEVDACARARR